MEEYNRMISSRILGNVENMISDVPQPTMFGGKRQRDFVLPASTDYDYPASLAVGHLKTSGMPQTLGGSFWNDFGETEFLDEDHDQYELEGGVRYTTLPYDPRKRMGADPRTYTPMGMPRKIGGKFNLGKALKPVAPIAKELGMTLAKEGIKEGVKSYAKGGKRLNVGKALKSVGKVAKSVGKAVAPVAKEVFRDVILPEGKRALRDYIRNMGKSSSEDMPVAYAEPVAYGKGVNRRNPPPKSVRPQAKPQRPSDKVASMIGRDYSDFTASGVKNPSRWIQQNYPAKKKGRKGKKKPALIIEEGEEEVIEPVAPKKRGRPKGSKKQVKGQKKLTEFFGAGYDSESDEEMDGGVLIRDVPSQFHSSVYPPALASYTAGRDAYGRGRACGGKKFNFGKAMKSVGKALKPVAPIAKELGMTLAKEGIKEGVKSYAKGGARGGARGAIVKEVMRKHGLSLPEASKFVKEHGLY